MNPKEMAGKIELLNKRLAKALRIRAGIIKRNQKALALIRRRKTREKGMHLLKRTLHWEKKFLILAEKGSRNGIEIVESLLGAMRQNSFTDYSIQRAESMMNVFHFSLKVYEKIVRKRIIFEKHYLRENKYLKKVYYLQRFKVLWRKELLKDAEIYRMIDVRGLREDTRNFLRISGIFKKIREMYGRVPDGFFLDEAKRAVVNNTLSAMIAAYPSAATYYYFSELDTPEKIACTAAVWAIAGFLGRVTQALIQARQIYRLAIVTHTVEKLTEMKDSDLV